jgi:hypothetical protein
VDKPLTAEDVAREWGEEFSRELEAELQATAKPSLSLDWAEPGDPPLTRLALEHLGLKHKVRSSGPPIALHLRANPLPRNKWPTKLAPWQEELLVLWWRVDLAENALTALVEAHRPMVVTMAQKYTGANRKLLIEYGMLGLRLAATRQWASGNKKGAKAGFDPSKGYQFNTYARHQAERLMREAAQRDPEPPKREQDTKGEFAAWAETPITISGKRPPRVNRDSLIAKAWALPHSLSFRVGQDYDFARPINPNKRIKQIRKIRAEFGIDRDPFWLECESVLEKRRGRPTDVEQDNKRQYYKTYGHKLATYIAVAQGGLSGWDFHDADEIDADGNGADRDAWYPCSGAFQTDQYKLPKDVLIWRWKLARARYGTAVPHAANDGLGLYDKFGARWYDLTAGKVTRKTRRKAPLICLRPAAGIYLVRAEEAPAGFRRYGSRPLTIAPLCHSLTTAHEIAWQLAKPPAWKLTHASCASGCFYIKTKSGWRPLGGRFTWTASSERLPHVQDRTDVSRSFASQVA